MFFLTFLDFLGFFLKFTLLVLVLATSMSSFIFSLFSYYYTKSANSFGWDSLKNILMNVKILFFEIMTILSRPLSLTLRLSINLLIGHVAGYLVYSTLGSVSALLYFLVESFIITLQVTVFVLLVVLYLSE